MNKYKDINAITIVSARGGSKKFNDEILKYEEEKKMPYITTAERIGIEKGLKQGITQGITQGLEQGLLEAIELGLKLKFGTRGMALYPKIAKINGLERLKAIKESIIIAKDVDEIDKLCN